MTADRQTRTVHTFRQAERQTVLSMLKIVQEESNIPLNVSATIWEPSPICAEQILTSQMSQLESLRKARDVHIVIASLLGKSKPSATAHSLDVRRVCQFEQGKGGLLLLVRGGDDFQDGGSLSSYLNCDQVAGLSILSRIDVSQIVEDKKAFAEPVSSS